MTTTACLIVEPNLVLEDMENADWTPEQCEAVAAALAALRGKGVHP